MKKNCKSKYGLGSWLKENASAVLPMVGTIAGGIATMGNPAGMAIGAGLGQVAGAALDDGNNQNDNQDHISQLPMNTMNANVPTFKYGSYIKGHGGYLWPEMNKYFANGGELNPDQLTQPQMYTQDINNSVNAGGTHEENPNEGVPIGNKSLVEEGEHIFTDPKDKSKYVFSNRLPYTKNKSFADQAKSVEKKYRNWEHDPIVRKDMENEMRDLRSAHEQFRSINGIGESKVMAYGSTPDGWDNKWKNRLKTSTSNLNQYIPDRNINNFYNYGDAEKSIKIPSMNMTDPRSLGRNINSSYNDNNVDLNIDTSNPNIYNNNGLILPGKNINQNNQGDYSLNFQNTLQGRNANTINNYSNPIVGFNKPIPNIQNNTGNINIPSSNYQPPQNIIPEVGNASNQRASNTVGNTEVGYKPIESNYLKDPVNYIPGALNMVANTIGMIKNKPNMPKYDRVSPNLIDRSAERLNLQNQATTSRNVNARNIRNGTSNTGEYLSNITAANAGLDRGLGEGMSNSWQQETMANQAEKSRVGAMNSEIGMKESENRQMERDAVNQQNQVYTQSMLTGVNQFAEGYQKDKMLTDVMNTPTGQYGTRWGINKKTGEREAYQMYPFKHQLSDEYKKSVETSSSNPLVSTSSVINNGELDINDNNNSNYYTKPLLRNRVQRSNGQVIKEGTPPFLQKKEDFKVKPFLNSNANGGFIEDNLGDEAPQSFYDYLKSKRMKK